MSEATSEWETYEQHGAGEPPSGPGWVSVGVWRADDAGGNQYTVQVWNRRKPAEGEGAPRWVFASQTQPPVDDLEVVYCGLVGTLVALRGCAGRVQTIVRARDGGAHRYFALEGSSATQIDSHIATFISVDDAIKHMPDLTTPAKPPKPTPDPSPLVVELERLASLAEHIGGEVDDPGVRGEFVADAAILRNAITLAKKHPNWPAPVPLPTHEGRWQKWHAIGHGRWADISDPIVMVDGVPFRDRRHLGNPIPRECMPGHYIPAPPAPVGAPDGE